MQYYKCPHCGKTEFGVYYISYAYGKMYTNHAMTNPILNIDCIDCGDLDYDTLICAECDSKLTISELVKVED